MPGSTLTPMSSMTVPAKEPVVSLNKSERTHLLRLEDVLQTARRWAVEEAKALFEIKARKLWRWRYRSFEEYGQDRWGFEHSQIYRLTQWGEVIRTLSPTGDYPLRESHARPLYGLLPSQQVEAWRQVRRRYKGHRTAVQVEEVVTALLNHGRPQRPAAVERGNLPDGDIICADAIDGIGTLRDGSVDLCLLSPPYCEQRAAQYPSVPEADYPRWLTTVMTAMKPKLADRGSVLIVAREHLRAGQISDVWLRTRLAVRSSGWTECETLIWFAPDKPPLGRPDRPRRTWEYIYWFSGSPQPFVDLRACGNEVLIRAVFS